MEFRTKKGRKFKIQEVITINYKDLNLINKDIGIILTSSDKGDKFISKGTPAFIEKVYKNKYFVSIPDGENILYTIYYKEEISIVNDKKLINRVLSKFIKDGIDEILFFKFNKENTLKTAI